MYMYDVIGGLIYYGLKWLWKISVAIYVPFAICSPAWRLAFHVEKDVVLRVQWWSGLAADVLIFFPFVAGFTAYFWVWQIGRNSVENPKAREI